MGLQAGGSVSLRGRRGLRTSVRRPKTSPNAVAATVVGQIVELRTTLVAAGLDAGPDTIRWHLEHHHGVRVSSATISRYLAKAGLVTPQPQKKPRSSYIRFEADQPNECWQSDFTHYRLVTAAGAPGAHVEILSWLDDHSRKALSVTAHRRITGRTVLGCFREAVAIHGVPASTLTDNGMVFTTDWPGGRAGATLSNQSFTVWACARRTPGRTIRPPAARSNDSSRP